MADISKLDLKLQKNLGTIHRQLVESAIQSIECNLDSVTIHTLMPFIVERVMSSEFLCACTQDDLLEMWDAISGELGFRREERSA